MEKYSTGLRNLVLSGNNMRNIMKGGKLLIYSGTQPTDADQAVQGTLLCTICAHATDATQWDDELQSAGSVELTAGASGSVDSITVATVEILGAVIPYTTDLPTTAGLVATQINKYNPLGIYAVSDGTATPLITLYAPRGVSPVTWAVVTTVTTITKTDIAFDTAIAGDAGAYGLDYNLASAAAITQTGTWAGVVTTAGTAGWFRIVGSLADTGGASTVLPRVDGVITSTGGGGDITLTSTALALSAPITMTGVTLSYEATGK